MTEKVKTLALRLLDRFDKHISAQLLLLQYNRDSSDGPYYHGAEELMRFTGLHGAAFLGIAEIFSVLEKEEQGQCSQAASPARLWVGLGRPGLW